MMRSALWVTTLVLAVLPLAPLAGADPIFPGRDRLELEHVDEGTIHARSAHDYSDSDWVRTFALDLEWSRIGVYTLDRAAGVDAFWGQGEEYVEATGTLAIDLDDQGVKSTLRCTLAFHETRPQTAMAFVEDDVLLLAAGEGMLDSDAWDCVRGGNEVVHGGAGGVPLASYAFGAAEGLASGAFPASLAMALGFAESEEEWAEDDEKESHLVSLVAMGYVEGEPELGTQSVPFARSIDPGEDFRSADLCGDITVTDTPYTTAECKVEGTTKIDLHAVGVGSGTKPAAPSGAATPAAPTSAPSGSAAVASPEAQTTNESPGAALSLLVGALALLALSLRRRA